jgi:hypothetical protein
MLLALLLGAGLIVERQLVAKKVDSLSSSLAATESSLAVSTSGSSLPAANPSTIASKLNDYSSQIVSQSQGIIDSATATSTNSTVTYTLKSGTLNSLTANALVMTNGDQLKQLADKALASMTAAGISNPSVIINLADNSGNVMKTLTYSK